MTVNTDQDFQSDLIALVPHMRAFARSLAGDPTEADDLAQEALLKAWRAQASYQPGTNLKAWVFMILRNCFLSEKRKSWRAKPLDQQVAEQTLVACDDPEAGLRLADVRRAMMRLPLDQREALTLIGAAGMSYEEAAEVLGCPAGTVKSRVSRGRAALDELLSGSDLGDYDVAPHLAFDAIMAEAAKLRSAA